MLKNITFISSDDRSGSTMLELILANSPHVFAAGELHNLPAYVFTDRSFYNPSYEMKCFCGKDIQACHFWQRVERELPLSFRQLQLRAENPGLTGFSHYLNDKYCAVDWRVRAYLPSLLKNKLYQRVSGGRTLAKNYFQLYEAIAKVSNKQMVIDSSKWPFRFRFLYDYQPEKVKVILLYRQPSAVVYSKIKRGESLEKSARKWNDMAKHMELFSREIPDTQKITMRYEDICSEPEKEITRLCNFLGIDFSEHMTQLRKAGIHHIGGSPSKFETSKTSIKVERQFITKLSQEELKLIEDLTPEAKKQGLYPS